MSVLKALVAPCTQDELDELCRLHKGDTVTVKLLDVEAVTIEVRALNLSKLLLRIEGIVIYDAKRSWVTANILLTPRSDNNGYLEIVS